MGLFLIEFKGDDFEEEDAADDRVPKKSCLTKQNILLVAKGPFSMRKAVEMQRRIFVVFEWCFLRRFMFDTVMDEAQLFERTAYVARTIFVLLLGNGTEAFLF